MDEYFAVLKQYAVFSGRAGRKEYWRFSPMQIGIAFALAMWLVAALPNEPGDNFRWRDLGAAGLPCADFAPDFARQDIACRQAAPGFEFALRHRWSLTGQPLTPNTPPLPVAAGHETGGQWLPDLAAQAALP